MFKTLLRKNFQEVGAMYFRSKKKGAIMSGGAKVGMAILYAFIYVSLLASFAGIASALFMSVQPANDWIVWAIMGLLAVLMSTIINSLTSYVQLYLARDNELLLSMPIKPGAIVLSRSVSVYLMGVVYASMAWLPTIIVGIILGRMPVGMIINSIITMFVIGFMVLALTCLIGWVIAVMSMKLKNQKILLAAICMLFIFGLYYLQFQSNKFVQNLIENADKIGQVMESRIYPFYKLGKGVQGDILSYMIFVAITAVLLIIAYYVLSKTFVKIATSGASTKKAKFKEGAIKTSSVDKALFRRERLRFFGSITYMLNSGLGAIIMIAGGGLIMLKSDDMMKVMGPLMKEIPEIKEYIPLGLLLLLTMLISMAATSTSAISIEGKQIWQIQSMPVEPAKIFKAKINFSWYLQGIPAMFLAVAFTSAFELDSFTEIILVFFAVFFADLSATFGLYINLKKPNLEWVSEQTIIKQGVPVTLTMFGGWGFGIVIAGLAYFVGKIIDYRIFLAVIIVAMYVCVIYINKWLRTKGSEIFATL